MLYNEKLKMFVNSMRPYILVLSFFVFVIIQLIVSFYVKIHYIFSLSYFTYLACSKTRCLNTQQSLTTVLKGKFKSIMCLQWLITWSNCHNESFLFNRFWDLLERKGRGKTIYIFKEEWRCSYVCKGHLLNKFSYTSFLVFF